MFWAFPFGAAFFTVYVVGVQVLSFGIEHGYFIITDWRPQPSGIYLSSKDIHLGAG